MKSTLFLICSLLCLLYFSVQIMFSGVDFVIPPDEAYAQVVNPNAASSLLSSQESFNLTCGLCLCGLTSISLLASIVSLLFLRSPRVLRWFRGGLLLANIITLLTCGILFFICMMESMQPEPECLKLVWPWQDSYWAKSIRYTQQAGMFLGLCCGMLSGVNCMAFYLFYRRRKAYND